ncbi:LysR family transcriptional regulator [Aquabacterium sp. A7-Y]|uniref:LysR family transcriptional regulator n=1 Tax=Aquabacterium sp. A7-Y TaxID=1349605 RepID=UPI00223D2F83|nr:LysR family transcriptional regulator [Aquabacterium sp. A7-Y]MCW7539221.1 LysR family transcriptional regulator [Aquabacterium sp. A7-Y]
MLQIDPSDLLLFARVAESGSFTRAAERVGLPKSTVSRRLSGLERQVGERLLLRTTRKLSLTDFGHALLEHARQVAAEVDAAASLALHRQALPSGRLRVSMPGEFAGVDLAAFLAEFLLRHPAISLEVDISARRVDLVGENFDLAIRMGAMQDDSSLAARRLFVYTWGLYAAPCYLALRGTPAEPRDLLQHDALPVRASNGEPMPWILSRGDERWQGVPPARGIANSPPLLLKLAAVGAGIVAAPDALATELVGQGALVRVLPDWCLPEVPAWAVFPGRRLMPAKTRVFLQMLEEALSRSGVLGTSV